VIRRTGATLIASLTLSAIAPATAQKAATECRLLNAHDEYRLSSLDWGPGEPAPDCASITEPSLVVFGRLGSGEFVKNRRDPQGQPTFHEPGDVLYFERGGLAESIEPSGRLLRAYVIALLGDRRTRSTAASRYPPAFPRPDSIALLDNDRVGVWSYTIPIESAPLRVHAGPSIYVWLSDGTIERRSANGTIREHEAKAGSSGFQGAGTVEAERAVDRPIRAVSIEIK